MLIGYMRVSTGEQNLDLQRDALERAGCERIYDDVCSGRATDRPGLAKALDVAPGWRRSCCVETRSHRALADPCRRPCQRSAEARGRAQGADRRRRHNHGAETKHSGFRATIQSAIEKERGGERKTIG